ncbi:RNA polymerase sigma factor [Psychrobacillus lasiicapitis]|uniref:Sigma-70 family RNA polymerase sigma factor n=1 Tax=Psychrobacillus lasiicapitis TaxID=1636719 RepID=A0A544T6E6_9BACI|nr:sigma-70 family RNA polymerase sigma factor [Psychrobacillus lasiicapitis]TQR13024.1 sigma-70 family RNA polymerase sigma factor [Psychrobacillus lasiicapitis]GGA35084.1 DNA-directed RNA polymerase sigma-70 factor [Psychrobacillus lasiicapitis]
MHEDILEEIKKGNRDAFRHLYDEYAGYAIRTAKAITRNDELAKDAVQEAFIRVYRNISSYDSTLSFGAWFYRILVNECNRLLSKEKKVVPTDTSLMEGNPKLTEHSEEGVSDLYGIIQHLADLYRIPLLLKYIKGFSEKEIADILNLNQNTVKSRLFNGRNLLREQLSLMEMEGN